MRSAAMAVVLAATLAGCGAQGDGNGAERAEAGATDTADTTDAEAGAVDATAEAAADPAAGAPATGVLAHTYRRLAGEETVDLAGEYGGKVLLIVNTASKCGYTDQYEGLEALHARLAPRGFAVLGFPSNDFMGQEPGTEEEIREFCTLTYGVKFPMFEKVVVTGDAPTPLYRDLAAATGEEPGWNFHKYLVDRAGRVVGSFPSKVAPDDEALVSAIEAALGPPDAGAAAPVQAN